MNWSGLNVRSAGTYGRYELIAEWDELIETAHPFLEAPVVTWHWENGERIVETISRRERLKQVWKMCGASGRHRHLKALKANLAA